MRILALDLGLTTGWAYQNTREIRIEHGIYVIPTRHGESPGMRFVHFRSWLESFFRGPLRPDIVVYEQPHLRGAAAVEVLVGLQTRVMELAAAEKIEYTPMHTATIKKFATDNHRASKSEMIEAAKRMFPEEKVRDDNEADAMLLLALFRERFEAL